MNKTREEQIKNHDALAIRIGLLIERRDKAQAEANDLCIEVLQRLEQYNRLGSELGLHKLAIG